MNRAEALQALAKQLHTSPVVEHIQKVEELYVLLRTKGSKIVAVYLLDMGVSAKAIKQALLDNTTRGVHSIFVMAASLLPEDGELAQLPASLDMLQLIYHQKIYAFDVQNGQVTIFPVLFRTENNTIKKRVAYFPPINIGDLTCEHIETGYPIRGFWAIGGFQGKLQWEPTGQIRDYHQAFYENQRRATSLKPVPDSVLKRYYDLLGLPIGADGEQIKQAFRQLARQFHPDLNNTPQAHERMQELNNAYQVLIRQFED